MLTVCRPFASNWGQGDRRSADVRALGLGNQGGAVDAQAVSKLRGHTDPASSSPIILHMR